VNAVPLELVAVRDYYDHDAEEIVALFREAVCGVQASPRSAATPADAGELDAWRARLASNRTLVAIVPGARAAGSARSCCARSRRSRAPAACRG
jgi:hypothetical protein